MKVSVKVTVNVDASKWATEFGMGSDATLSARELSDIREDVKQYLANTCIEQVRCLGLEQES